MRTIFELEGEILKIDVGCPFFDIGDKVVINDKMCKVIDCHYNSDDNSQYVYVVISTY